MANQQEWYCNELEIALYENERARKALRRLLDSFDPDSIPGNEGHEAHREALKALARIPEAK